MILVSGATGLLGSAVMQYFSDEGIEFVAGTHFSSVAGGIRSVGLDLYSASCIRAVVESLRPDWIVHCAALTNVDYCERNPEAARELNVLATRELAQAAAGSGARLLYISTDSVFDGERGDYTEHDAPNPLNWYARSKLEAEGQALEHCPGAVVLRTNLFGWSPAEPRGLAEWGLGMLSGGEKLQGFTDCQFNPQFTYTLAGWIRAVMQAGLKGLYHVGTADAMSKWEFLCRLAVEFGYNSDQVMPVSMDAVTFAGRRPKNTFLNANKLAHALGRPLPSMGDELKQFKKFRAAGKLEKMRALVGNGANGKE